MQRSGESDEGVVPNVDEVSQEGIVSLGLSQKLCEVSGHLFRSRSDGKSQGDPAMGINDKSPGRVVYGIVFPPRIPEEEHAKGIGHSSDFLFGTRQAKKRRMERSEVPLHPLWGVPVRVHGDEENLDPLSPLLHLGENPTQVGEREGTHIGARRVPEEDHQDLPCTRGRAEGLASMGSEGDLGGLQRFRKEVALRGVLSLGTNEEEHRGETQENPGDHLEDSSEKLLVHVGPVFG